jgi:hypothetical protein
LETIRHNIAPVLPPAGHVAVTLGTQAVRHDRCIDSGIGYFARLCGTTLFIGGACVRSAEASLRATSPVVAHPKTLDSTTQ